MAILAYGISGRLQLRSGTWTDWTSLGGAGIAGNPTAARNTDGRLEVFVVGGDTGLWHKWQTAAGGSTWTDWTSLGGSGIANNPTAARNTDGRLEVFVVGGDTGLWHKWQTAAGSSHMDRLDATQWFWCKR